jgi:hypothetical protein
MNSESSRSHCIVTVTVEKVNRKAGSMQQGKLCMVDLAGEHGKERCKEEYAWELNGALGCSAHPLCR